MPFKSIEEGWSGCRVFPFMRYVAKDIPLCAYFSPHKQKCCRTQLQSSREPGKERALIWAAESCKALCWNWSRCRAPPPQLWWSQTSCVSVSTWHLHQQRPWLWLLILALFSLQRWMYGDCPAQKNNDASCSVEQAVVRYSSTANLLFYVTFLLKLRAWKEGWSYS